VRFGVGCSEHLLCQIILHCLFGVQFWSGETPCYGAMLGRAALSTRSAKSSCIVCSACSFGMGRHATIGVFCSEHSLCQIMLHCLLGVQSWSGETP